MSFIINILSEFWSILAEMSPYLILGFAVAGILSIAIPTALVRKHLGKNSFASVLKASLFGIPLPLCSCGVLPVTLSLQKSGAGKGACISFLLATPQIGIHSIAVTYALLGPVFAVLRTIFTFITGVIGGAAVNISEPKQMHTEQCEEKSEKCCCENSDRNNGSSEENLSLPEKLKKAFFYGFSVLPKDSAAAMLLGIVIAAFLTAIVPEGFLAENLGRGLADMLLMVLIGMPIYVCSSASVPIAAAMILKGLSPGAALVFLMTGPATNAASFTIVWKQFGAKTAVIYMLSVIVCAVGFGLLVDYIAFNVGVDVISHCMFSMPAWFKNANAIILLYVLISGIYAKTKSKKAIES